jgi:Rrf2 family protein
MTNGRIVDNPDQQRHHCPRMRMTTAGEYGCLALLVIGEAGAEWRKRQEIADRYDIPGPYLEQILRRLTMAGFVVSRRGADGGFRLARPAREIVIADVIRAVDGPLAPTRSVSRYFYQPGPLEASPAFQALFTRVRDAVAAILEETTLEDILDQERTARRGPRPPRARRRSVARPAARRG